VFYLTISLDPRRAAGWRSVCSCTAQPNQTVPASMDAAGIIDAASRSQVLWPGVEPAPP